MIMNKNQSSQRLIHTFSIVAYDPQKQEWGVAVQSKFLAAAAVVSWAQANAGAVATQSYANVTYGSRGLELMGDGLSAEDTIKKLINDPASIYAILRRSVSTCPKIMLSLLSLAILIS